MATVRQTEEPASSFSFAYYTVGSDTAVPHWQLVAPSPICTTTSSAHTGARRREAMFPSQCLTPQVVPSALGLQREGNTISSELSAKDLQVVAS